MPDQVFHHSSESHVHEWPIVMKEGDEQRVVFVCVCVCVQTCVFALSYGKDGIEKQSVCVERLDKRPLSLALMVQASPVSMHATLTFIYIVGVDTHEKVLR